MARKPIFESNDAESGDYGTAPSNRMSDSKIALFFDFENIAIGVMDAKYKKFEVNLVLERLLEKGKIVVKRAYCDWDKFPDYKRELHEAAVEMIEIPGRGYSGKNSADIRMAVDAMDMCWSKEHIDLFVIASGDSDFSPLVSKLKENDKYVIGVGVKNSSSDLLIDNCDEFIFYEDLVRGVQKAPAVPFKDKKQAEVFKLLIDSIKALMRENKEILWGSMVKQTMQRKKPTFNEEYYGYNTFSDLLEDAQNNNIIKIKKDAKSGSYVITGFAQPAA
ncbi:MAG TPA: NYN domain-containing protein [Thermoanaerobaculia bacterium]|nr:NYN domain-containing protein [Thermoanaerobaculia bacterium]